MDSCTFLLLTSSIYELLKLQSRCRCCRYKWWCHKLTLALAAGRLRMLKSGGDLVAAAYVEVPYQEPPGQELPGQVQAQLDHSLLKLCELIGFVNILLAYQLYPMKTIYSDGYEPFLLCND
ncbi:hypothetical protein ABZP36_013881 [Zizania latifolia]